MCPRPRFWYRATPECTLILDVGTGEHPNAPLFRFVVQGNIRQNHLFGNHPFANPRAFDSAIAQEQKQTHKHKKYPKSPSRDPTLKILYVEVLSLENKGEEALHVKNLGSQILMLGTP